MNNTLLHCPPLQRNPSRNTCKIIRHAVLTTGIAGRVRESSGGAGERGRPGRGDLGSRTSIGQGLSRSK